MLEVRGLHLSVKLLVFGRVEVVSMRMPWVEGRGRGIWELIRIIAQTKEVTTQSRKRTYEVELSNIAQRNEHVPTKQKEELSIPQHRPNPHPAHYTQTRHSLITAPQYKSTQHLSPKQEIRNTNTASALTVQPTRPQRAHLKPDKWRGFAWPDAVITAWRLSCVTGLRRHLSPRY